MSLKPRTKAKDLQTVRQFQSEVASVREEIDPIASRLTLNIMAALCVAGLLVMYVVRLDRVITSTSGQIVTTEPTVVFAPLDNSIVKSLNVREGQRVEKGQLLATLDPTFAASTVNQLKAQIDSLKTEIARDEAEIAFQPLVFPPNSDPDYGKYEKVQQAFYDQQMNEYKAQVNSFDQKISLTETTIQKFSIDEFRFKDEGDVNKQIEDMYATLHAHGNGSLISLLTATISKLENVRNMEYDKNSVIENTHLLASQKADREAYIQQFLATASQDLVTSRNSLDTAETQLAAALKHQDLVRWEAPEASIVMSVAKVSVGSILMQGTTLITLTPIRVPIEAEVWISPQDVGFMRPGDKAELKVDAFNYTEYGTAEGKVRWVSEDTYTTDANGAAVSAYYKARIVITATNFIDVPATFRLIPGMTLEADIIVGTHSMWDYVIGEIGRNVGDAMREP